MAEPLYPDYSGHTYVIKSDRWDKNMSYGFGVWEVSPDGNTYTKPNSFRDFDLPINPSNISISIPFAINTIATTRGILEEHNGVVFRHISISGTTGVASGKRKGGYEKKGGFWNGAVGGVIKDLAANTLSSVASAVASFNSMIASAKGSFPALVSAVNADDYEELGYAKLHKLLNYFVSYSKTKTQPGYEYYRLVFYNKKDNVTYVVTPVSFDVTKSADSPHTYNYKISLKAWAIAEGSLDEKTRNLYDFSAASPGVLSRMMNTLRGARSVLSSAANTVRAVALDFNAVMGIGGEAMLVVKDAGGFYHTCADFPDMMANQWNHIAKGFEQKAAQIRDTFTGSEGPVSQPNYDYTAKGALKFASDLADAATKRFSEDPNDAAGKSVDSTNPLATENARIDNIDGLDQYGLDEISLSPSEQETIDDKTAKARALTINDWDTRRRKIETVRDAFADSRGLSDITYDAAARRATVAGFRRLPTLEDYTILKAFNDIISVIDGLSATNDLIKSRIPDPFARAREIVGDSGITITSAVAAYSVPFPYNGSLETLASRYLGDPDRWIEIAILNDLKSPFIDETGFVRSFTTSGNKNSFTISDRTNLYPNQEVFLSSLTQRQESRRIVRIDELGLDNYLVTVDGDDDLSRFTAAHQASVKAYLPNTINSNMVILIPCPSADGVSTENLPDTKEIPVTMNLNQQQRMMGVDISLTENFDLAVKNDGDVVISTGLANAIQAIKLKLATEVGQLKRHQEYGAGLPIGQRLNMTANDIKSIVESAIMADPRFVDVPNIIVQLDGGTVRLNITVSLMNEGGVIPVSFQL